MTVHRHSNFQRLHRGWGEQPKQAHRTWLGAWWQLRRHRRKHRADAGLIWVYPCWFTDQNTTNGPKHYHIGHAPGSRTRAGNPPVPGKLYVGVFAVPGGFEARTFTARPPRCLPVRPTIAAALAEYREGP